MTLLNVHRLAYFFCIFVLSLSPLIIRWGDAPAEALGFWRMAIAAPILLVVWRHKAQFKDLSRTTFAFALAIGFFLFLHLYTWILAVQRTTVANAILLFSLNPLFTSAAAWALWKTPLNQRTFLSLILGLLGGVTLYSSASFEAVGGWEGFALAILSTVAFSGYVLVSQRARQTGASNLSLTSLAYTLTALAFFVVLVIRGKPLFDYPTTTWIAFFAFALGPTLLGHALFTYLLQFLNVQWMSAGTLLEPLIASALAHVLFGEPLSWELGLSFIFISGSVLALSKKAD